MNCHNHPDGHVICNARIHGFLRRERAAQQDKSVLDLAKGESGPFGTST